MIRGEAGVPYVSYVTNLMEQTLARLKKNPHVKEYQHRIKSATI